jgi:hypothetical protein
MERHLFEQLENIESSLERRRVIKSFLETLDFSPILPKGEELTQENSTPSDYRNKLSLPFAVGFKYLRDEPYEIERKFPVYVLGVTSKKGLLVVDDNNDIFWIQKTRLENPLYSDITKVIREIRKKL